ncbi:MAG: ankyrin repeat domain-containing protein [Trebonia sp.]
MVSESPVPLPEQPSLEQLRNQAKDLRRTSGIPLWEAQLSVARRYGFTSWARLKQHVELLTRYSRFPERVATDSDAGTFLRLACLSYYDDEPGQWEQARRILERAPGLAEGNVYVGAATADAGALRRVLAADPAAASREGGPFQWEPLCYLAYARHDPAISLAATLETARLLLDAEADPNSGYLWHGLPTPFTTLTGVFGEGEAGPVRAPRHPHSLPLARLLLEAGADPNDGQALYNRMFEPGNDHLELLFEFGLGTGDGGPWRRRLGDALDTPAEMVRGQLAWTVTHGMTERVRLLVEHGVDVTARLDGVTATSMAATTGHADLVDYLVAHGAPPLDLPPADAFVAAALAADRARLGRLLADHPGLAGELRAARPALITWAAACGNPAAVEILAELGFDVNAKGRTDVPSDQPWQTALHKAAEDGNVELARTLLRLGADPDIRDHRFDSTPLGWARHFGQQAIIELLEPLTAGTAE